MKKIKNLLLSCLLVGGMVLTGCSTPISSSSKDDSNALKEIYEAAVEQGYNGTYEEWIALLKGDKGDPGKDGTNLINGEGVPSNDLGKIGDAYVDLLTWNYYVKLETGWELKGNIKGEDYVRQKHTVIFDTGCELLVDSQEVLHGEKIKEPNVLNRDGYEFDYWTYNGEKWSFDGYVCTCDMKLEAKWSKLYTVTWKNFDGTVLEVDEKVKEGSLPSYDGALPVRESDSNIDYLFRGWDKELNEVSSDITYVALYCADVEKDQKITLGKYPQSKVTNANLLNALNKNITLLPTENELNGWTSYKYYQNGKNTIDFMWYKDVEFQKDLYRAVYFTSYRPYFTTGGNTESSTVIDNNGYLKDTVYWFKYEPINWTVKSDEGLIFSDKILDAQDYFNSSSDYKIEGTLYHTNNYAMSNVRKFLNNELYNTAFNTNEKTLIERKYVRNTAISTGEHENKYSCENTNDNVFLLSRKEIESLISDPISRATNCTDYAACMGCKVDANNKNSFYWLRSPFNGASYQSFCVNALGETTKYNVYSIMQGGIRPAMYLY